MVITWSTRNIQSLFPLKDKNDCKSFVIRKGVCSCGLCYNGETKCNAEIRWIEHNNPTKSSETSNTFDATSLTVLHGLSFQMPPKNASTRKNLKA